MRRFELPGTEVAQKRNIYIRKVRNSTVTPRIEVFYVMKRGNKGETLQIAWCRGCTKKETIPCVELPAASRKVKKKGEQKKNSRCSLTQELPATGRQQWASNQRRRQAGPCTGDITPKGQA